MTPNIEIAIPPSQNGFVRGRQLPQNPVDLDRSARVDAFRCQCDRRATAFECMIPTHSIPKLACFLLLDFATAFASVAHQWLFSVLEAVAMPHGFVSIIRNRYLPTTLFIMQEGSAYPLFRLEGCVMRGCPLSEVLFLLAIDPLLWLLAKAIVAPGFGRACSDNIANLSGSLEHYQQCVLYFQFVPACRVRHCNQPSSFWFFAPCQLLPSLCSRSKNV